MRKLTEEHKRKIAESHKGKLHTQETKDRISKLNKGKKAWNKGLTKEHPIIKKMIQTRKENYTIPTGNKASNWKGGLIKAQGYYYVYNVDLGTSFGGKYIKRANYVWYLDKGELIKSPFILHHLDGNRENDDIRNLVKIDLSMHSKITTFQTPRDEKGRLTKQ